MVTDFVKTSNSCSACRWYFSSIVQCKVEVAIGFLICIILLNSHTKSNLKGIQKAIFKLPNSYNFRPRVTVFRYELQSGVKRSPVDQGIDNRSLIDTSIRQGWSPIPTETVTRFSQSIHMALSILNIRRAIWRLIDWISFRYGSRWLHRCIKKEFKSVQTGT